MQQMTESDSEGYGRTWSERRNAFSRCKWDCICVLIRRIAPIGQASTGDVQFPTDDSAGLATALAAAIECSTDALDILSPAEGAAAASNMLIPIFEMLQHVLPVPGFSGGRLKCAALVYAVALLRTELLSW